MFGQFEVWTIFLFCLGSDLLTEWPCVTLASSEIVCVQRAREPWL